MGLESGVRSQKFTFKANFKFKFNIITIYLEESFWLRKLLRENKHVYNLYS